MPESLPDTGLSHDTLALVGCVVVQWALMEWALNDYLRKLLKRPEAEGLRPQHIKLTFGRRLALYRQLAEACYDARGRKAADMAAKMIAAAKGDRDWLAHGMLSEDDSDLRALRSDDQADGTRFDLQERIPVERLRLAAQALERAAICLHMAHSSKRPAP